MENKLFLVKKSSIDNYGVFANKNIKKGTRIAEYMGERITKEEGTRREKISIESARKNNIQWRGYIFELNESHDIDGDIKNNPAKFLNHSCDPNCEYKIIGERIFIFSKKNIKMGEELSFNYGYGIDDFRDNPCRCGSSNCIGYILEEESWHKLGGILGSKPKKKADLQMKDVEVRRVGKHGRGVFALKEFKKSDVIIPIKGKEINKSELFAASDYINSHSGTIGKGRYLVFGYPEKYINHSCDPNCYEHKRKVMAIRDIKKGEELSFDYSICSIDDWRMRCKCESKNCRKIVRGNFFRLPIEIQKKYLPYLDEWFREEYKNELRSLEVIDS